MLLLKPISATRVWGDTRLYDYCGDVNFNKIGSVYSIVGTKNGSNEVINSKGDNFTLYDYVTKNPRKFGLKKKMDFPLIISFTSAFENCSIQVHPTDSYAEKVLNLPYGKDESWYFIKRPEKGFVFCGINEVSVCKGDRQGIYEKLEGNSYSDILRKVTVNESDILHIPSGTVHALTKGSLIYEIQMSTDITYRFYDYDRVNEDGTQRELQIKEAEANIKCSGEYTINKMIGNKIINYPRYSLVKQNTNEIINNMKLPLIITNLEKDVEIVSGDYEKYSFKKGMSMILFNDEMVQFNEKIDLIVAWYKI